MRTRLLVRMMVFGEITACLLLPVRSLRAGQGQESTAPNPSGPADEKKTGAAAQFPQAASKLEEIVERMIKREHEEMAAFDLYSPIVETYIQVVKPDKLMGSVPKSDFYFLGQADFRSRLKVRPWIERRRKISLLWSFEPAEFLQMIFVDRGEFDRAHYKFSYSGREFLGEVRCYVFDVSPAPKVRGPRFVGRICGLS